MGRFRRRMEEYRQLGDHPDPGYAYAFRKMKRIKGFYVHLFIYIVANMFIILSNYYSNNEVEFWSFRNFSTAFFWGIGLASHGLSVFGRDLFFGSHWEEKKIQEFMKSDKNQKWE